MRKQRNAAFTDEIITNQKGVSAEKYNIESSDTSGHKSRGKNRLSLEYGTENLGSCRGIGARRDGSIDVTHSGLIAEKARKYGLSEHLGISDGG